MSAQYTLIKDTSCDDCGEMQPRWTLIYGDGTVERLCHSCADTFRQVAGDLVVTQ